MAAAGPQMVASIRATGTAKLVAQAKGVLQGQLDAMRTLPYRVAPAAGDHRDLLDTYYRNTTPPIANPTCGVSGANPPSAASSGYVAASNAGRCAYELAGVAMYRKVLPPGSPDLPAGFAVVLNTTFVTGEVIPRVVAPAAGYNSQLAGKDYPSSSQVGVTATVLYSGLGGWKPVTVYTQIASRTAAETRIKLQRARHRGRDRLIDHERRARFADGGSARPQRLVVHDQPSASQPVRDRRGQLGDRARRRGEPLGGCAVHEHRQPQRHRRSAGLELLGTLLGCHADSALRPRGGQRSASRRGTGPAERAQPRADADAGQRHPRRFPVPRGEPDPVRTGPTPGVPRRRAARRQRADAT